MCDSCNEVLFVESHCEGANLRGGDRNRIAQHRPHDAFVVRRRRQRAIVGPVLAISRQQSAHVERRHRRAVFVVGNFRQQVNERLKRIVVRIGAFLIV